MSVSHLSDPETGFVCGCEAWMRTCSGEAFYGEHSGNQYCVLHYPGKEKHSDFQKRLQRKLDSKDFDFRGVWFPDELPFSKVDFSTRADFRGATFSANANFTAATFSANVDFFKAIFSAEASFANAVFASHVDFYDATFSAEADFRAATFSESTEFRQATFRGAANFRYATFKDTTNFRSATFAESADFFKATFTQALDFSFATFSADAYFSDANFHAAADFRFANFHAAAYFRSAILVDHFRFAGDEQRPVFTETSSLDLQFARIKVPDRVSFHTLRLRPHWFVNVDTRKFDLVNVQWDWSSINAEIKSLKENKVSSPHPLLAIACRHLAVNAEENHRYEEASKFRYMAMDARRSVGWRGLAFWRLGWWYWLASGYGERVLRAFLVLLGIWFVAGLLYARVGFARWEPRLSNENDVATAKRDDVGAPLKLSRALMYSAGVMTLQKPEPRPATRPAQTVVLLETILGPVQAALLALAIRRKFMR